MTKVETEEEKTLKALGALLLFAISMSAVFWDGFVMMWLWRWFVSPLGLVWLGYWEAVGLYTFWAAMLIIVVSQSGVLEGLLRKGERRTFVESLSTIVGNRTIYALFLGMGWVVHTLAAGHP